MSQAKIDRKLHVKNLAQTDRLIRIQIAQILRERFSDNSSAIKAICRDTGVAIRAARNWYDGENSPSLLHFVILARCYPEMLELLLGLCNRNSSSGQLNANAHGTGNGLNKAISSEQNRKNVRDNVRNHPAAATCNARQLWFMIQLGDSIPVTAVTVARHWGTSQKTAERDIRQLRELGLVIYEGARRKGYYVLAAI